MESGGFHGSDSAQEDPREEEEELGTCDGCEGECGICSFRHDPTSRYQQRHEE